MMIEDPVLLNDWHVVARSSETSKGEVRAARLLGQDLVVWRSEAGVCVWKDLCVHRGARLSGGRVANECLICPYHGWQYDGSGRCVRMPAHPEQPPPARAHASVFHVTEKYGLGWVCLGTPTREVPEFFEWEDASIRKVHAGPYLFK